MVVIVKFMNVSSISNSICL